MSDWDESEAHERVHHAMQDALTQLIRSIGPDMLRLKKAAGPNTGAMRTVTEYVWQSGVCEGRRFELRFTLDPEASPKRYAAERGNS
jgi:hypothetical protein